MLCQDKEAWTYAHKHDDDSNDDNEGGDGDWSSSFEDYEKESQVFK